MAKKKEMTLDKLTKAHDKALSYLGDTAKIKLEFGVYGNGIWWITKIDVVAPGIGAGQDFEGCFNS